MIHAFIKHISIYKPYIQASLLLFLFHFIFESLGIFMVMISIVKIELINATENYLLKYFFSLKNRFFEPIELFLIHSILLLSGSSSLDIK